MAAPAHPHGDHHKARPLVIGHRDASGSPATADDVARLALQLHDSPVAEGVIEPEPDERELLWAAALLHDIGMSIG